MPGTREIRRRIRSVKNTAQITKAMQMVAASKMRKAQQAALAGRPYANLITEVLAEVTANAGDFQHRLMDVRPVRKTGVIVVGADKGLCGALNTNLMREAAKYDRETTVYIAAGRKAAQFMARTKRRLEAEFSYKDAPLFGEARAISLFAQELFLRGEVDRVDLIFTHFLTTLNQRTTVRQLLPVTDVRSAAEGGGAGAPVSAGLQGATEFLFEPSAKQVFGALLPHYVNLQVYQVLLEAKASEHSARMVAMKGATDNAQQLIKDLTLEFNKVRQANITKEILEMTSATLAMT